jgi:hypothetical protein
VVADNTREGEVFKRLFAKLETERQALGGRVFDILGEAFENRSLKDMLIDAIRYGDDPAVRARLDQQVEGALDTAHLRCIMDRNALSEEVMTPERLFAVKEDMERAQARKLQPHFIRAFFLEAFSNLHGVLRRREAGRFEITHVPAEIRERDKLISHSREPVLRCYERVCFERSDIRLYGKPMAALIHPGQPLMAAVTDLVLQQHRNTLRQGAVLLDPADAGTEPRLVLLLDHVIREPVYGTDQTRIASRRLQFVTFTKNGLPTTAAGTCPATPPVLPTGISRSKAGRRARRSSPSPVTKSARPSTRPTPSSWPLCWWPRTTRSPDCTTSAARSRRNPTGAPPV